MKGLLDTIFSELDLEALDEKKCREYLLYLNEVLPQTTSKAELQKFLAIQDQLIKKLARLGSPE